MVLQAVSVKDAQEGTVSTNTQKTRWASPSDWDGQKQHIIHLYKSLDYPLWKVIQKMQKEHDFMATQKMYKYNLHRWGVRKNLRAAQVQEFLQDVCIENDNASVFVVGGIRVDRKRLEQYIKRAPRPQGSHGANTTDTPLDILIATAPGRQTPIPARIPQNSFLPEFERLTHAMKSYIGGSFDAGLWMRSHIPWHQDLAVAAHNRAWTAGRLINSGHMAQGFRLLNLGLDSSRTLLAAGSPLFPMGMYTKLFESSKRNEALTRSIISFMRDLVLVTYRSGLHPVYVLFDTMAQMTSRQMCEGAWTLWAAWRTSLLAEMGGDYSEFAAEMSDMHGHSISWLAAYAPVEDGTAESALQEHARALSVGGQTTFEALQAKLRLANFFLDRRRYGEARRAAEDVLFQDSEGGIGANNAYLIDDCHRVLFWVSRVDGSHEDIVKAASRWVGHCTSQLGASNELTVDALGEVADYFRDAGDTETAEKAHRDHEMAIDDMCERLGRVGLGADASADQKRTMLYGRMSQRGDNM